jgi:hypothetical protein
MRGRRGHYSRIFNELNRAKIEGFRHLMDRHRLCGDGGGARIAVEAGPRPKPLKSAMRELVPASLYSIRMEVQTPIHALACGHKALLIPLRNVVVVSEVVLLRHDKRP